LQIAADRLTFAPAVAMSRNDKLLERIKSRPRDLRWDELVRLLRSLGFEEVKRGKTGGSRRRFVHPSGPALSLHEPHPSNIVRSYVVDQVLELLTGEGLI
jgi:hypothetical protein